MHSARELNRLAARKTRLLQDISSRRVQCAQAATRVVRPLARVDGLVAVWRQLPPLAHYAAVPVASLLLYTALRWKILRGIVRWSPLAIGAVRVVRSAIGCRRASSSNS